MVPPMDITKLMEPIISAIVDAHASSRGSDVIEDSQPSYRFGQFLGAISRKVGFEALLRGYEGSRLSPHEERVNASSESLRSILTNAGVVFGSLLQNDKGWMAGLFGGGASAPDVEEEMPMSGECVESGSAAALKGDPEGSIIYVMGPKGVTLFSGRVSNKELLHEASAIVQESGNALLGEMYSMSLDGHPFARVATHEACPDHEERSVALVKRMRDLAVRAQAEVDAYEAKAAGPRA